MGDELQRQVSSDNLQNRLDDSSANPVTYPNAQSSGQQNMEFDPYPQQQFAMHQYGGGTTMDMRSLAGAVPDYGMRQYQQPFQHQFPSQGGPNQNMMYQYQQGSQYAGQTGSNFNPNVSQQYHSQYIQQPGQRSQAPQYSGYATSQAPSQSYPAPHAQMPQDFQHGQPQHYLQIPSGQYAPAYTNRVNPGYQHPQMRSATNVQANPTMPMYQQLQPQPVRRTSSNSSLQGSAIRGPPRKPKQSGHALWVGNLPPGTHIIDLKDHFSRDAISDIESVFLISKSNCAFVNYKTEASCAAAMSRFHDSRFQGVRLVCRLRRGSAVAAGVTQPSIATTPSPTRVSGVPATGEPNVEGASTEDSALVDETATLDAAPIEKVKEKFFVVKSLTIEDLERSVQTGVWATQAHNETALNKAYQAAENVYLIFSANKSGEYFGYARMESSIDDEASAKIETPLRPESSDPVMTDLPLTIPTPATATAPKGRIIDDSSRGTIFWEADNIDKDEAKEEDSGNTSGEGYESAVSGDRGSPAVSQSFGKPFKIVWVSTERLPFYRTRGLRNPWNANREVKIARDGTEIEPSVGRRLVGMFHRPQINSTSPGSRQPTGMIPVPGGYMSAPGQMPGNPYGRSY